MELENDFFIHMHNIMKYLRQIADKELSRYGIKHTEMRILMLLCFFFNDGGNQDEISARLEIDRSNVGRSLKKLEVLGYIERKKSEDDGRAYKVFLNEKGRNMKDKLLEIRSKLHAAFVTNLDSAEVELFLSFLKKAEDNLFSLNS